MAIPLHYYFWSPWLTQVTQNSSNFQVSFSGGVSLGPKKPCSISRSKAIGKLYPKTSQKCPNLFVAKAKPSKCSVKFDIRGLSASTNNCKNGLTIGHQHFCPGQSSQKASCKLLKTFIRFGPSFVLP